LARVTVEVAGVATRAMAALKAEVGASSSATVNL